MTRALARLVQAVANKSKSFSADSHPRLSRIAHLARSAGTPIAASTWLGATLPDEQADPEDTATPARSSAITSVSAGTPGIAKHSVCGKRATPALNTVARGADDRRASRSRQPAHWPRLSRSARAASAAAPKPAMAATFSVPARVPPLLPAAGQQRRKGDVLARPHDGARSLRPADLVGRQGQHIDAERADIDRACAPPPGSRR